MAESIGALRAELSAGHAQFSSDMRKARQAVETNAKGMAKGMETAKRSFDSGTSSLISFRVKAMAAMAASGLLVKSMIKMADEYTLLDNKLKLVTKSSAELTSVQDGLYRQALASHSSYSSSVDLYSRFAKATETLGIGQAELLRITETLNKAMIISGATQQEATNGIIQLSQGMASGVLRGEEFNSIMENGSRIARMLSDYLEVDIGTLRKMAAEGKITSEVMIRAFTASTQKINEEFSKMEPTISQTMTDLKTVFGRLVSDANKSAEGTKSVAGEIGKLAQTIDQNRSGIIELFTTVLSLATKVIEALGNIGQSIRGWAAWKRGDLGFFEFASMNAEELSKWLGKNDSQLGALNLKMEKARLEWVKWNNLTKQYPSSDPNSEFNTKKTAAAKKYNEILKERNALMQKQGQTTAPVANPPKYSSPPPPAPVTKATKKAAGKDSDEPEFIDEEEYQTRAAAAQALIDFDKALANDEAKVAEAEKQRAETMRQVQQVLDDIKTPQEEYNEQVAMLDDLMSAGELTAEQYTRALENAKKRLADAGKEENEMMEDLKQSIEGWGRDAANAIVDFALEGKGSFKDFADSVIKDMLRMIVYQNMIKPIMTGVSNGSWLNAAIGLGTSLLGSFGGGSNQAALEAKGFKGSYSMMAHGGAFQSGRITPFASGGIVKNPTVFPMANGMGLMGEAGAEAIMPLKRMPNGDLGIQGGNSVSINVPITMEGSKNLASELRREIEATCEKVIRRNS